jgi:CubicO group peptidase (beta-lactamase class C family)
VRQHLTAINGEVIMFRTLLFSVLALGAVAGCRGAGSGAVSPPTLESLVRQTVTDTGVPGLAVTVISTDSIRTSVAGVRKVGATAPIEMSDRFHLGSNIKAMTATLAAALVDAGIIQWNTTLAQVFPEMTSDTRSEYQTVTLAQLLTHRGGIIALTEPADLAMLPALPATPVQTRYALTRWLLAQAPPVTPGSGALYSNAGYAVAAAMLERKTGRDFESLLTELVLRPLNAIPLFDWPAAGARAQPWGHERAGALWLPNDPDAIANHFPGALTPAGNLSLSVGDYASFVQSHLRGLRGRGGSISPQTYAYLHTSQGNFALGWLVKNLNGVVTSAHDGSTGTFYALVAIQPTRDRAVVVLANSFSDAVANAANALALELLELKP